MTNFEKYKDEILFIANGEEKPALVKGGLAECMKSDCKECKFCVIDGTCTANLIKWLYEEYKEPAPTLTPKERAFCEMFCGKYVFISRSSNDDLLYLEVEHESVELDNTMFKFIQNEVWSIKDLLKLEVCE